MIVKTENKNGLPAGTKVKAGYKQTKLGWIPEGWRMKPLIEVTLKGKKYGIVDGPFGSNLKTIHYRSEGIPIITSGYVTEGSFNAQEYLYVEEDLYLREKRSSVSGGDIVMAKIGARCGASAILPRDHETGILSGNALKISVDEDQHSTYYVWSWLWKLYKNGKIDLLKTVGAQPAISISSLKKYKIPIPPLPEQQKIAQILSTWDKAIGKLEALIIQKQQRKKGLMQTLLTGKKRFKEFVKSNQMKETKLGLVPEDWEVKKLKDVANSLDNRRIPLNSEERAKRQGKYPYWGANGILDFVDDFIFDQTIVLLAEDGGYFGEYQSRPIANISYGKAWVNNHAHVLEAKIEVTNEWLYYTFVHKNILGYVNGGTRAKLNKSDMLLIPCIVPPIEEQKRITQIFINADSEITNLETQLNQIKEQKKGLMQKLLTGEVRVKIEEK